ANMEDIATHAVGGAVEAAGSIGTTALRAVREMLVGVMEGVRDVAGAALPVRSGNEPPSATGEKPPQGARTPGPDKMREQRRKKKEQ
ncbi:MAG: hypothetical protein ABSD38_27415, partial [Syntrophorhabdales bacterium]